MLDSQMKRKIRVDGLSYQVEILQPVSLAPEAPRLIMVCYLANESMKEITRVCIQSIRRNTDIPHELWVVDNNSPGQYTEWLSRLTGINLILNRTTPLVAGGRSWRQRLGLAKRTAHLQMKHGSYANAVGLELAIQAINPKSHYVFLMHNDVLACKSGWLSFLISKLQDNVKGAAVCRDPMRIEAMHVSGLLFDFRLYEPLNMSLMPNLPEYDVADQVTLRLREADYGYYVCKNTFNDPRLIQKIPADHPLATIYSDRAFDDDGNVIFAHLGRGTPKAAGRYAQAGKTYPEQWVEFADCFILS